MKSMKNTGMKTKQLAGLPLNVGLPTNKLTILVTKNCLLDSDGHSFSCKKYFLILIVTV